MNNLELPSKITIDGIDYAVNTDFKTWIEIGDIISNRDYNPFDKTVRILKLCYTSSLPTTLEKALNGILEFYRGTKISQKSNNAPSIPVIDFLEDFGLIAAAFYHDYKIDLWQDYLHWWQFRHLFSGLSEENKIIKIMGYRGINIGDIKNKEQKQFYKKMKDLYRLKDYRSPAEQEQDMLDKISGIFEEVK